MRSITAALVGYGMFGADVVIGTLWDLQRNGLAPYLDRVGLDDWAARYQGVGFDLVAVGARSEASARRAEREMLAATGKPLRGYHGEAPWLDILRDFPALDVLIVATPDHLHTAPILAALERGVHVVTEKPLCLDLGEADRIIDLAREQNRVVAVDMHKRYDPDHLRIFDDLRDRLGTPLYARGVLEEPLEVSTTTFKWAEQSDPFSYVGIHWADLFMHYLDLTPLSVYAVGQKQRLKQEHGKDAFDSTQVLVTHTNGMAIIYENNWLTPPDFEGPVNQESHMVGTRGKVESDSQYRGLRYWVENAGSRTANTHFFRKVRRPDGSLASQGYGKDSLVVASEKVFRCALGLATANELAGSYPDAPSLRRPTAVVHATRAVLARNEALFAAGQPPVAVASLTAEAITLHDPATGPREIYRRGR
jgi:predicted dehydrogenase